MAGVSDTDYSISRWPPALFPRPFCFDPGTLAIELVYDFQIQYKQGPTVINR
jgi:hypothetical protein